MTTCDVLVAGGGSAGIAAAISAARAGAEVLLIERGGLLGGMGTSALVHTICGLYLMREEPGVAWANDGFPREFAGRLLQSGGAKEPVRMGRVDVLPHDPVSFAALADAMVNETPRLNCWLHSELVAADFTANQVQVICRGERREIHARAFIDTTGDATLTVLGGAAFEQVESARLQRPAYIVGLRGFPPGFFDDSGRLKLAHAIAAAVKSGELPGEALGTGFRAGMRNDEAFMTIDLTGGEWDPCAPELLAEVEFTGRRTALAIVRHLREKIAGCESCVVAQWPSRAGVRESRRAAGVYELPVEDLLSGTPFPDAVAVAAWPVELREKATGPRWRYPEPGVVPQIPLRSLKHRAVENLWVAGRCLSASHEAQASIRVMGTCLATGEAAALAAVENLRNPVAGDWQALATRVRTSRLNSSRI
ncbi:MAG: FAD-dependent oxidoreductase [Chthoniobacteraceae bacterium]